jgi:hypothetical protein
VFVKSEADAIHTAEVIRDGTYKHLKYKVALPDHVKNTLSKLLHESTSEEFKRLCLSGYFIICSEMTASAR